VFSRLVQDILAPNTLIISSWSGTKGVNVDRRGLKPVLGWLVWLAMSYGAIKMRFGIDRKSGESWMKILGPKWYNRPIWSDIVPPESYCYPTLLQICLSLAKLDNDYPIRGVIPATSKRKHIFLEFSAEEIDTLQISWDSELARDRQDAGTTYPEENIIDSMNDSIGRTGQ